MKLSSRQEQQNQRRKKSFERRHHDSDHRYQVEERRRKQEEENQAKFEEILRRNQQRFSTLIDNRKAHTLHNPSTLISHSSSHQAMTDRRVSTDSSSTAPKENSSCAGRGRTRPSSYAYWLNTGDQPSVSNANFMRSTYAATCRSRFSRSVERCPRACRGQEDSQKHLTTNTDTQRRLPSINRQQLQETICRLAKPKTIPMPSSQSSHQLRASTPPVSNTLTRKSTPTPRRSLSHTKPPVSARTPSARSQMSTSQSFLSTPRRNDAGLPPKPVSTSSGQSTPPSQADDQTDAVDQNEEYQRKLTQKIREAQQRLELERQQEEERQKQIELEEYQREQEQIRLVEEQRQAEEERLRKAIEERERENELKRQEELRLAQQKEELERKQAEEAERLQRERVEKAKKEEEERNERKKRLDLIMRRTRPVSPQSKSDAPVEITNGHEPPSISHSSSSENILDSADSSGTSETPKFKSPLLQTLLDKARNSRSTDNLSQSTLVTSEAEATF